MEVLTEEINRWISDLLNGMLDPAKIMEFVRVSGIDMSQLSSMISGQPNFDPYQLLKLE